jgi:hypothetical protein
MNSPSSAFLSTVTHSICSEELLAATPRILAKDLAQYVGKEVTLIGWLLTEKIVSTKKGEPMELEGAPEIRTVW